ncbi:Conserved oligomeric Golgi complex subunit 4 [Cryptosporidium felis]|nr:Conserved oligomeric Golgi complex subunit 4 [Cryptosporidium felis]
MSDIKSEEGEIDASLLLNLSNFSNLKHEFDKSKHDIQNLLLLSAKELLSMKNEVLINLEKGIGCYSSKIDNLPSIIKKKENSRFKLKKAIQLVDNIISLKKLHQEFKSGMLEKNYEICTKSISNYLVIRASCINLEKEICDELDKGRQELYIQLCTVIDDKLSQRELDKAIYYVRLLVPLGMPSEGLERYVKYIKGNVGDICVSMYNEALSNSRKRNEKINYGEIFTGLYISIVDCIKENQDKVIQYFVEDDKISETFDHYKILDRNHVVRYLYIELLKEVNVQGSIIIDKFEKDYSVYLDEKWTRIENINIVEMGISHRDLDRFLEEASKICHLSYKFKVYINSLTNLTSANSIFKNDPEQEEIAHIIDNLPNGNELFKRIEELSIKYVPCEYGYVQYSIDHALNITDEISWDDQESLISTLVEDVFFLLHKTINRCISIGSVSSLKLIIVHLNHILLNMVKQKITKNLQDSREYYESSLGSNNEGISSYSNKHLLEIIQQRNDNKKLITNSTYSWTHSLNNLQACIENLEILSEAIVRDFENNYSDLSRFDYCIFGINSLVNENKTQYRATDEKVSTIEYIIRTFEQIIAEYKVIHDYYSKLSLQILSKISISPILIQIHEETTFNYSEAESKEYSLNHSFIPSLTQSLKIINEHIKTYYNGQSSEYIISLMIERIVQKIEHITINYPEKKRFTIYGALVFENDVRNLLSYTNSLLSISIRHKFLRLLEICDILNITSLEELKDLLLTDFPTRNWHLTKSDILKVLFLRQDFDHDMLKEIIKRSNHFFN